MTTHAHLPLENRLAQGKALRKRVPRLSPRGVVALRPDRPNPVAMLEAFQPRLPARVGADSLLAARLHRHSLFLRGSAMVMANDLSPTPTTGITAQLGGDCHLLNFGGFATPERHFIFDVTDFDETLPGPWEWDVKRLAASVVSAGRVISVPAPPDESGGPGRNSAATARTCAFAGLHVLDPMVRPHRRPSPP